MTDAIVELLGIDPARVESGELIFVHGDPGSTLSIWKGQFNRATFGWTVTTYDRALREQMERFGGMGIQIEHPPPW